MASNIVFDGTKGISLPSFTTTEKNAIVSPSEGALIYDTTLNQTATYDGSSWNPNLNASSQTGLKNRIINGAMMIDQRNAGASITPTTNGTYCLDRYRCNISQSSKFAVQQVSAAGAPVGFTKLLVITSLSAYSILSSDNFNIQQRIEGNNVADLYWGTADAKAVTLSFWAYSTQGGTFGGSLRNNNATRSYPFSYVLTANTWTYVTINIAGDTTGTWETGTSTGIEVNWGLGVGSTYSGTAGSWASASYLSATGATSVVGTNGATFYITGVQLEKGSTATSFDYRPYGTELALCQRYYEYSDSQMCRLVVNGPGTSESYIQPCSYHVTKRVAVNPSVTFTYVNASTGGLSGASVDGFSASYVGIGGSGSHGAYVAFTISAEL